MDPRGKVALVTGGAHRVGKAITMMLARAGATVVVNYHSADEEARQTVREAEALGVEAMAVHCNVADLASVQAMAGTVEQRFGTVDILVNAASLFQKTPIPLDDYGIWHAVTDISIDGAFYVSNTFARGMLQRGAGVITNIVDLSVWQPWPNLTAHAVGKGALMTMTHQLALELAPAVRVNAVAPGPVLPPPDYNQAQLERVAQRTLLKRWGSAADVAHAVRYLVEADYVTGDVLLVDGGEHIGSRR